MTPGGRIFDIAIERVLDVTQLSMPSAQELERAEDEGDLASIREYQDLRGFSWGEVVAALRAQAEVAKRLSEADDPDQGLARYEEARFEDPDAPESLYGLDIGVAPAVLALSALGCVPVSSCDASAFGGHHTASCPVIAFYLPRALAPMLLSLAQATGLGLMIVPPEGQLSSLPQTRVRGRAKVRSAAGSQRRSRP